MNEQQQQAQDALNAVDHDAWVCVTTGLSKAAAKTWLFDLAAEGIDSRLFTGSVKPLTFHVAVRSRDAQSPALWLLSIRGADAPRHCMGSREYKHLSPTEA